MQIKKPKVQKKQFKKQIGEEKYKKNITKKIILQPHLLKKESLIFWKVYMRKIMQKVI